MKNIIFFIFMLFVFCSCSDELITIVDEYNPPYQIKAIPSNNSISVNFWSGVLASDFVGFNIYAGTSQTFTQPTGAITNSDGGYPTIKVSNHVRSNFTLTVPPMNGGTTYQNGTLYYVTVTAYGTNDLLDSKYIETQISSIVSVIPREEGTGTGTTITVNNAAGGGGGSGTGGTQVGTIDTSAGKVSCQTGWKMQSFGPQSDFNSIVIITNTAASFYTDSNDYILNGLYIFSNSGQSQLAKVWITGNGGSPSYKWAYHDKANQWNGI